jgi:hypothetical protein
MLTDVVVEAVVVALLLAMVVKAHESPARFLLTS